MAKDMKARNVFRFQQAEHILCHGFRLVTVIGLFTIGESPKIWRNKRKPISKPLDDGKKLTVVLRPTMHAQNGGTTACRDVVKINAIRLGAFMR